MAKNDNLIGVFKIEIGAPGDGVMGGSLTTYTQVELNSLQMTGAESNETTIPTETEDAYLTLSEAATAGQVTFRLYEAWGDDLALLMGGSYDSMAAKYSAPVSLPENYYSVRITTQAIDGKYMRLEMPYCKVSSRHNGNLSKGTILACEVTCTINTPVTSGDVKNPPYDIIQVTGTPS